LSFNGTGSYKVTLGNQTLYEGNDPEIVIALWNEAY